MAPTFRLRTFGGALIEGPNGPLMGAATQRRRLAVLGLLAASGGGISRDRLVAFLWPESDDERARHALAQLLYVLRQELGGDVIAGSATALSLNTEVLSSDVRDFEQALERRDLERAALLHTGPFLDGFFLSGCDEFERWVDRERARLAHQALAAMESLAVQASASADPARAAHWWRRLAATSPLDSRIALQLMKALVDAGDRAGAIRHARVHETMVGTDLGVAPDAAVAEFAQQLASSPDRPARSGQTAASSADAVIAGESERVSSDLEAKRTSTAVTTGHQVSGNEARTRDAAAGRMGTIRSVRRSRIAVGLPIVAVAAAAVLVIATRGETSGSPHRVVMADVENLTADSVFDHTIPLALAAALGQSPGIYIVPPERIRQTLVRMRAPSNEAFLDEAAAREVAQRDGAGVVVVPSIATAGGRFEVSARLVDPASGGILALIGASAPSRDRVLDALDDVARRVRREMGESRRSVAMRSVPLPFVTTSSLDALEKYAEGSRAFEMNRLPEAEAMWLRAVATDSGFAMAWAALGMLYYWSNRPTAGDAHFEKALANVGELPERDQVLIRAQVSGWRGDREASTRLLRTWVLQYPQDLLVWSRLGYEYLRMSRREEAADAFLRVIALDTLDAITLINLATVEKGMDRFADAITHYRRAFTIAPSLETTNNNLNLEYGGTYVKAGDLEAAAAVFGKLLTRDRSTRARGLRSVALLATYRGNYTEATRHLSEAILLNRATSAPVSELRNRLLLASTYDLLGRPVEAAVQRDSAFAVCSRIDAETTLLFWTGKSLARAGDIRRASQLLETLDARVHASSTTDRAAAEALRGEVLVASGRSEAAVAHLEIAALADSTAVVLESMANAVASAGDFERAAVLYEALARGNGFGWEGQEHWRMAAYLLGRTEERRNDPVMAARAYDRFLEGWQNAEPSLPPVVDARERLARLRRSETRR